jgi:hypothetical protein
VLPNGKVLVAAGEEFRGISSAELYDPVSGTWTETGSLAVYRSNGPPPRSCPMGECSS